MNGSEVAGRVILGADGTGVVSHAGVAILGGLADLTGLSAQVSDVLADTYRGPWRHDPGRVFTDVAAAVADGADCVSGIGGLADRRDHRTTGVGFSFGFAVTAPVRQAVATLNDAAVPAHLDGIDVWNEAISTDAPSVTAPGWPRPPTWSICRRGRPTPD